MPTNNSVLNARNWSLLLNAIEEQRVVPVIGNALINVIDETGQEYNIIDYLLKKLKNRFSIDIDLTDFSDVEPYIDAYNRKAAYGNIGDTTDIYYEIYDLLSEVKTSIPPILKQVIDACRFPMILTTSFANDLWKVFNTSRDHELVYMKQMSSDIRDMYIPSAETRFIYHLFGRANMSRKSFVATDEDLLDYMHYWHNGDTRPKNISNYLSDKFLLVLGCSYPDWLFRFFWHSMRNFSIQPKTIEIQGVVSMDHLADDKQLGQFLSRIQASVYDKATDFLYELSERCQSLPVTSTSPQTARPLHPEIFISYASEDLERAKQVYDDFCKVTGNPDCVWFDKPRLEGGDKYEDTIIQAIQECKRFVPIISENTLLPGRRFFKMEWKKAIEENDFRGEEPFIIPIIVDRTDHADNRIPMYFKQLHTLSITDESYATQLKRIVRSYR